MRIETREIEGEMRLVLLAETERESDMIARTLLQESSTGTRGRVYRSEQDGNLLLISLGPAESEDYKDDWKPY